MRQLEKTDRISSAFAEFHRENPHVYSHFKDFATRAILAGVRRTSSKFIIERIRWELMVETRSSDFKINNNFTSRYARLFIEDFPQHHELFALRELKCDFCYRAGE